MRFAPVSPLLGGSFQTTKLPDDPSPAQPRLDHRDDGHLFPDAEELGRGAIDEALGENLAELEPDQDPVTRETSGQSHDDG
jgi:hypothetical protein